MTTLTLSWYTTLMTEWTPEAIKRLRNKIKLTQKAFAARFGLTEQYIYLLESGRRTPGKPLQQLLTLTAVANAKEEGHGKKK